MVVGQLGEGLVETHDVAGQFQAARAQRCLQQAEGGAALGVRHLLEADALAHVEVLVHPLAPFRIVHREHGSAALLLGEARQEPLGGGADGRGRNAGGMNAEEAGLDGSVGGDAFEWLGQTLALVIGGHLPEALGHVGGVLREGVRGENGAGDQGRKQRPARQTRRVPVLVRSVIQSFHIAAQVLASIRPIAPGREPGTLYRLSCLPLLRMWDDVHDQIPIIRSDGWWRF